MLVVLVAVLLLPFIHGWYVVVTKVMLVVSVVVLLRPFIHSWYVRCLRCWLQEANALFENMLFQRDNASTLLVQAGSTDVAMQSNG